jgi:PAS domain S-box-containing protein
LRSIVEKLTNSNNKDGLDPQILDILFDGIWITDKEDIIVYVNNSMLNMAGDSKDKIIGTKVLKSYTNGTFQHFIPFYFKAKDLGKPVRYEQAFIRTPAGRITQQTGWMIPRYFQNNFSGIICSVSNVTDAKLLAYSEAKFQALCNSSPNCIFLIDLKGIKVSRFLKHRSRGQAESPAPGHKKYPVNSIRC